MKTLLQIMVILLVSLVFVQCDKTDFPTPPYPAVQTREVSAISANGVTFEGVVLSTNDEPIEDHGFVWGLYQFDIDGQFKASLGAKDGAGAFTLDVTSALYADTLYYVKAYVKTKTYTVYGEEQLFTSAGSHVPVIESFLPGEGTGGDTVVIKGNYFTTDLKAITVRFGAFEATVLSSSNTEVKCRVPADIPGSEVPIVITLTRQTAQAPTSFKLQGPTIETFAPQTGTFGDIVTLQGNRFDVVKEKNIVKFNDVVATVVEATSTSLKVSVPTGIRSRETKISIAVGVQVFVTADDFIIQAPVVQSLSSTSDFMGQTLTLTGANFNPERDGNVVLMGGQEVPIVNASKTTLVVNIPVDGVYKTRSFNVEVQVAGQSAFSQDAFTLKDAWIRKADVPRGVFGRFAGIAFALDGKGYVGLGTPNDKNEIWQYTPSTNTWAQVAPFPGPGKERTGAAAFVLDGSAFVGGGAGKDFWRYDPQLNRWTQIADVPYTPPGALSGLSAGGKGYVVVERQGHNFYEYDPATDSWRSRASLPTSSGDYLRLRFTLQDKIYGSVIGNTENQFYQYDATGNAWNLKTTSTLSLAAPVGCVLDGKGFTHDGSTLFRYDPTVDSWETKADKHGNSGTLVFSIDGKAYVGSSINGDLWEYDPAYD